jgi:uncharacterized protein YdaU (DUF1376 family)
VTPDPMTPPECDLRGLEYMPLLGQRLFGSEFDALANDSEWRAGITLWWAAWTQCPAASLPDDDQALCRLADLGRDIKTWRKLKNRALHGFVLCSDGRLYHPTLAEQALIAWDKRRSDRNARTGDADRKARERAARSQMFKDLEAVGVTPAWNTKTSDLRELVTLHVTGHNADVTQPVTLNVTAKTGRDGTVVPFSNENGAKPDSDKAFWDNAKGYLGPKNASLIGKWVRDHGKDATAAAITAAQLERAVNPVEFIQGSFRRVGGHAQPVVPL